MLPDTAHRVESATAPVVNRRIAERTEENVRWIGRHSHLIDHRLAELDREWDVERMLEANAATLALTGSLLGMFVDRRFLWIPAVVAGFLLQHALQGWCPPLPVLRRLGVRTMREIQEERAGLMALGQGGAPH